MKRNLFLVSAMVIATLASCTKDSELDATVVSAMSAQSTIQFTSYASSSATTKGSAVSSNTDFEGAVTTHGSFNVKALISDADYTNYTYDSSSNLVESYTATPTGEAVTYFDYYTLTYNDVNGWESSSKMYWPNYSKLLHFAAYSPTTALATSDITYSYTEDDVVADTYNYEYSFPYTVTDVIADQVDLMYAMTSVAYLAPSDRYKSDGSGTPVDNSYVTTGAGETNDEDPVNLHFKHALTQIAFTATKDTDIEVYVKSLTICNVYNSGTFTATVLTNDDEADSSTNPTIGDNDGDKVDGENFGSWEVAYDENGWGTLTEVLNTNGNTSYFATAGHTSISNYAAALTIDDANSTAGTTSPVGDNSIQILDNTNAVALTSSSDVLILMPQALTAWVPTTSTEPDCVGVLIDGETEMTTKLNGDTVSSTATESVSYLAIDCEIYHANMTDEDAKIHTGYIFVPFDTTGIEYSNATVDGTVVDADAWLPGYKITYCLHFGGGYIVDEDNHTSLPLPGCVPDTDTYTLSTIVITATADNYVGVTQSRDLEEYVN